MRGGKLLLAGYVKPLGTTIVVTSLGWLLFEVNATYNNLKTIGRSEMIHHGAKYITISENITKGLVLGSDGHLELQLGRHRLAAWLSRTKYHISQRLLAVAQSDDSQVRLMAVRMLASMRSLSPADLIQLAQSCDCHSAVGLARSPNIDQGYFLSPPSLYKITDKKEMINEMRDILFKLNQQHGHLCVKFFLSKAFPGYEKQENYLMDAELMLTEPWQILTTQDNLLPLCIQALDHHLSSVNSEVGWIKVLSEWVNSKDLPLSVLAGQCLINLDRDNHTQSHYGRNVVPLHPLHRSHAPLLDVVFVHGLLGGVLTTWRQRDSSKNVNIGLQKDDITSTTDSGQRSSDSDTVEYLTALSELAAADWDQTGSDFEFVVSDFPVNCKSEYCDHLLTLSGRDPHLRRCATETSYSLCWPKDWLSKDCSSIRLLGVDYESRISEWFPTCSEKIRARTLQERATVVSSELESCSVGQRPTVWVAHSMGGLLVKKILTQAAQSSDESLRNVALNTKAIVFLSTPHLGCPLAKMNDILNYLLWPSTEVEELRQNSDVLNKLHQEFNDLLKEVNIRIVTFAEAKSTRVSTLGVDFHIVPPEFSYFDVGDLYEMPCDHACVAKPFNRLSFIYQTVLHVIKSVKEEYYGSKIKTRGISNNERT
ncbi:protein SERAC1 isoform X2 [Macrosteles quadrilineatus]|uniref:protein SERAC1 isoform X2 n=1 Tax=Macrosteles quadrilineatus TaxID=74068 RepID=UPI0023E0A80E|nr:protein SERAC1 isoform X2 [Macrosteles quadrilineatus]